MGIVKKNNQKTQPEVFGKKMFGRFPRSLVKIIQDNEERNL